LSTIKPIWLNFAHTVVDPRFGYLPHSEGKQTRTLEFGEKKGLLQGPSKENGRLKLLNSYREVSFKKQFYLFIYFWLCWVFVAVQVCSSLLSRGYSSLRCLGFSLRCLLLWSVASMHVGSVVVTHRLCSTGSTVVSRGLGYSAACGIFPDQGSSPCLLRWQVDSLPLNH